MQDRGSAIRHCLISPLSLVPDYCIGYGNRAVWFSCTDKKRDFGMHIIQLTPGAGTYYTGAGIRDHTLAVALRRLGHKVSFVPLFQVPMVEEEELWETPLFYDQAQVYKQQQAGIVNKLKALLMNSKKAAKKIERMTPTERGELLVSLLQGVDGRQAPQARSLIDWLKEQKPDVICLSDATLLGIAPELKKALDVPIIVSLQGEARQLDSIPKNARVEATKILTAKAAAADAFIAPSDYYASTMMKRLGLPAERVRTISNGIALNHFSVVPTPPIKPAIGFLGRLCEANGLANVIKAFKELRKTDFPELQLRIAGAMSDGDLTFIAKTLQPLNQKFGQDIKILRNIPLDRKVAFLHSLTVLCAAAPDKAFGLNLVEAMAVGLPVVAPKCGGFPELIRKTGGGVLAASDEPKKLAKAIGGLLKDQAKQAELSKAGRAAVLENYSVEQMAGDVLALIEAVRSKQPLPGSDPKSPEKKKAAAEKTE